MPPSRLQVRFGELSFPTSSLVIEVATSSDNRSQEGGMPPLLFAEKAHKH